ncbi:histone-fold-containing protein [Sphaerosporella brunnea]|uniref:Histone-fold-containing protein n=1 Tax=Sphaerosporella brunnea TaxID=1250544 RepID=A0A5J5EBL1_9PEZI|nr:histone-fold-containing protein [Sphaerosporella brunnea]
MERAVPVGPCAEDPATTRENPSVLLPDTDIRHFASVARIMKTALPENAKIAKEAKECMQECVSEFISFITSEASEKCQQEKRKTVNGEDILFAMTSLGFENYAEALKIYLAKYRESQSQRNHSSGGGAPSSSSASQLPGPSSAGYRSETNQTLTPPLESEEQQQHGGYGYGHVAGNGDGGY